MLLTETDNGVRLSIRLTPKASADRLQGIAADSDGNRRLKVQVRALPEDGKANAALLKLLAKTFKCPKTSLTVVSGATDRNKVVDIHGDPKDLSARIGPVLAALGTA